MMEAFGASDGEIGGHNGCDLMVCRFFERIGD